MREIPLNDLPDYSPWLGAMLGGDGQRTTRTLSVVLREYGVKYRRLLDALNEGLERDYDLVRQLELDAPGDEVALSVGGHLYAASLPEAMETSLSCLMKYLLPEALLEGAVLDLGCGYGYLLHRLKRCAKKQPIELRGGELSPAGVEVANLLDPSLGVETFDFYGETCAALEASTRPTVVTTSYALHQLTSARPAVDLLARYREKISVVVSLEPEEEHFGGGLLGILRRRYGRLHGYSADLGRVLQARGDVKVEYLVPDAVGANALLPATVTIWRFS